MANTSVTVDKSVSSNGEHQGFSATVSGIDDIAVINVLDALGLVPSDLDKALHTVEEEFGPLRLVPQTEDQPPVTDDKLYPAYDDCPW